MRPLVLTLAVAGGWGRAALVAATTALVSGLLLVVVAMVRMWETSGYVVDERVLGPVRDEGTRAGAVLGVLLLVLPLVLLLDQAVRLGTTARRRRFAALAVAGATRADLRRWGAVEVGVPALAGAVLGVPLWWLLRQLHTSEATTLVPTSVGPGAWSLLVVLLTGAYGALVGVRLGTRVASDVARRAGESRPPRPWSLLLLVGVVLLVVMGAIEDSDLALVGTVGLLVLAIAGLAPWSAYLVARVVAGRATSPALLLAGRRLQADPRPAGRAAAAIGAVGLTVGVLSVLVPDIISTTRSGDRGYYLGPALLAGLGALAATLAIAVSLAIHLTESVLERRRELAALVATGVPARVVSDSQRLECLLATVPLAVLGAAVGGLGYAYLDTMITPAYVLPAVLVTGLMCAGTCWLVTLVLRPWLLEAVHPEQLRTT